MFQGIYPEKGFNGIDALIVSAIAIVLVFAVLTVIILVTHGVTWGVDKAEAKFEIKPSEENKLLEKDEDAVIAALTATIDFHKETKKDAKLVSIERIDEE